MRRPVRRPAPVGGESHEINWSREPLLARSTRFWRCRRIDVRSHRTCVRGSTVKHQAVDQHADCRHRRHRQAQGTSQACQRHLAADGDRHVQGRAVTAGTANLALVGTVQTAKLELTTLPAGSHTFTATYNGSTDFTPSTSLSITITVGKSTTTTTATTSTPAPTPGQDVKLKAVVKAATGSSKPTGSVTFKEGPTTLGTVALALVGTTQTAKLTVTGGLGLGSHTIVAAYAGSSTFEASNSTVTLTVAKGSTLSTLSVTPVTGNPGKSTIGVAVAAVAPARGVPSGLVTFVVDTQANQVFSLNSVGKVQFSVMFAPGTTHTVKVTYGGDSLFNSSTATTNFTS
jgi:hypothetical protein